MTDAHALPTILLPLDGSEMSERAAGMAVSVARRLGGRLLLLHVPEVLGLDMAWYTEAAHDPGAGMVPVAELLAEARSQGEAYLARSAAALQADGLTVETVLGRDVPSRAIVRTAEETGARMIVMATHGWGGLTRWAFGSVADKVLHTSATPVLLVRSGAGHVDPTLDQIMVTLDGSLAALQALEDVRDLAAAPGCRVLLVHVIEEPLVAPEGARFLTAQAAYRSKVERDLDDQVRALAADGIDAHFDILAGDDVAEAILKRSRGTEIDLVCLTTHGRGGLERWALGSVTDRVIRESDAPVLVRRVAEDAR